MAQQAEALGVEIFPGFPPPRCSTTTRARQGRATGNMGVGKDRPSRPTTSSSAWSCTRKYTILPRRARPAGQQLLASSSSLRGKDPQTYAIGVKELWEIRPTSTSRAS
jgi:electron-transferring-flavoprotein dehydrogenase